MSLVKPFKIPAHLTQKHQSITTTIGNIVDITDDGVAVVDFPENTGVPVFAKSILTDFDKSKLSDTSMSVLLVFEQSDPSKPVITGFVNDKLFTQTSDQASENKVTSDNQSQKINFGKSTEALVDGKKVKFEAQEEILLKCGKSSILLRKDGKVVIKGTNLISRSSASNKIKGSSVSIN